MAEVVKGNRQQQVGQKLDYFPPVMKDGVKVVKLDPKEIEEQNQKWSLALIGYVIGGNPAFKEMLKFVYGVWNIVNTPQVYLHNDGYFLFRFDCEEDKSAILQNGPYIFNYRPLVLKQWSPDFQMSVEPDQNVPMWVMLPNLPIQFWTAGNLGRIASCLGRPICTDKLTTQEDRIAYARMLIEMDISQPLPDDISLEMPNGKCHVQVVEYERKPLFCQDCLQMGHATCSCKEKVDDNGNWKQQQLNKGKKNQKKEWREKNDTTKEEGKEQELNPGDRAPIVKQSESLEDADSLIINGQQTEDRPTVIINSKDDRGKQKNARSAR
ncbi:PREDICTED: uncharacterized protein LOC109226182 [Nicotiana attenuata]|uniref:uncharacterized protein LOC109226182 n=1 Tax=Nicotiana attenuata TaxID=49451 RepID=UPI000904E145|nr:PREDICTED: uncharacterized protein LOC109226182 [Nicotiana attenuata]